MRSAHDLISGALQMRAATGLCCPRTTLGMPSLTALALGVNPSSLSPLGADSLTLAANASWDTSSYSSVLTCGFSAPKSLLSPPLTYAHALALAPNATAGFSTSPSPFPQVWQPRETAAVLSAHTLGTSRGPQHPRLKAYSYPCKTAGGILGASFIIICFYLQLTGDIFDRIDGDEGWYSNGECRAAALYLLQCLKAISCPLIPTSPLDALHTLPLFVLIAGHALLSSPFGLTACFKDLASVHALRWQSAPLLKLLRLPSCMHPGFGLRL
jgi:hypothetical protein